MPRQYSLLFQSRNARAASNDHAGGAKEPSDRSDGACLLAGLLVPALSGTGSQPSRSRNSAICEEVARSNNGLRSATSLGRSSRAADSPPSAWAVWCWGCWLIIIMVRCMGRLIY